MFCDISTMGAGGWLAMSVFWVAVIFLVVWVVGMVVRGSYGSPPRGRDALDIVDARFARGEIDPEEYRRTRSALEEVR